MSRRRLRDAHARHHGRRHRHLHRRRPPAAAGPRRRGSSTLRGAHLVHFRVGAAATAAAAARVVVPPAALVPVALLVLDNDGAPRRRRPRQEDGCPAGARVQQREDQEKGPDGAEHDAGDGAGRRGRVLLLVGRRDGLEAVGALRRADREGVGGCHVEDGRCGCGAFGW